MKLKPLTLALLVASLTTLTAHAQQAAPKSWGPPLPDLKLPDHPRIMLSDAEIPAILQRVQTHDFARDRHAALIKKCDEWAKKNVELPPRGGQWWHWYACKKDGNSLTRLSPTEHKCPACGTLYSGYPYDDVVLSGDHDRLSGAARDLGLGYRLTKNSAYADKAREILLAYAAKYQSYPLHDTRGRARIGGGRVLSQTLDESIWLIGMCQGMDLIWDRLSDDDRAKIETGLLRPAADIIMKDTNGLGKGLPNIRCWMNSAVGIVGFLLGDRALIADAITSDHGFYQKVTECINDDGQWIEGAWGYHFYTINAMIPLAEAGARCGVDLYGFKSGKRGIQALFDGPMNLVMPNMILPPFSDSDPIPLAKRAAPYEVALARYGDPRYASVLQLTKRDSTEALLLGVAPLPQTKSLAVASNNYPAAGYAVLTHGAGADATWLCFKYGPYGGGHGHPDKLSFILYSRGTVLGYDPGTGKYGPAIHNDWQKASIAHNTLTVDETNQASVDGRSLNFVSNARFSAALSDAGPIYKGVTYRRAVALVGADVILVLDLVNAEQPRTLDISYHNTGTWTAELSGAPVTLSAKPSYQYLEKMVEVSGPLPTIKSDKITVGIALASAEKGSIIAGTGAGTAASERIPCVLTRIQGDAAHVAWAMDLQGSTPTVKVTKSGNNWIAEATIRNQTYRLITDGEKTLQVE